MGWSKAEPLLLLICQRSVRKARQGDNSAWPQEPHLLSLMSRPIGKRLSHPSGCAPSEENRCGKRHAMSAEVGGAGRSHSLVTACTLGRCGRLTYGLEFKGRPVSVKAAPQFSGPDLPDRGLQKRSGPAAIVFSRHLPWQGVCYASLTWVTALILGLSCSSGQVDDGKDGWFSHCFQVSYFPQNCAGFHNTIHHPLALIIFGCQA